MALRRGYTRLENGRHALAIGDEIVDNFNAPARNWAIFQSPGSASGYSRSRGQSAVGVAAGRSA